jgi:hypothetical protein
MHLPVRIRNEVIRAYPIWGAVAVFGLEGFVPLLLKAIPTYVGVFGLVSWAAWMQRSPQSGASATDPVRRTLAGTAYFLIGFAASAITWWLLEYYLLHGRH